MCADTHYLSVANAERSMREMETVTVQARLPRVGGGPARLV